MMDKPFHQRRRQQFLTESYYKVKQSHFEKWGEYWRHNLEANGDSEAERRSLSLATHADYAFILFALRYTAGEPIESLRAQLEQVVGAYERYQKARAVYEEIPEISPLGLGLLDEYEQLMQILGLGVLLHRPDLVVRMAALIDPGYKGEDALYEDLLSHYMKGRIELDEWYYDKPYTPLIQAMYESDDKEASAKLEAYCKGWYSAFKYIAPWHDGHLRIEGTDGDYFGYWAFEAGAVAYLCNIDDSAITHMVYPRDLVAWAREHKDLSKTSEDGTMVALRAMANEPCPKKGWWSTPARSDSRRQFKIGETMPSLGGDYGATIWQWEDVD